jgi:hypothetical protein
MLEIGPAWIDRYVREILMESIANGLEGSVINGSGLDQPIGMMRDPNGAIDPATGYASLVPVPLSRITPEEYGALIASLAVGPNLCTGTSPRFCSSATRLNLLPQSHACGYDSAA